MIPRDLTAPTDADAAELAAGGWRPVGFERLAWRDPVNALVFQRWERALELARADREPGVSDNPATCPIGQPGDARGPAGTGGER